MHTMILLRTAILLVFLHHLRAVSTESSTSAKEDCTKKLQECTMGISGTIVPVCASDGVTYPNQCEVVSRQCQGASILVKHTGPCREAPSCFTARTTERNGNRLICRPDGTYAPMQCHEETGYCWCVTPQGRPLRDSWVKNRKPKCARSGNNYLASTRSGQRRRSPSRKNRRQYNGRHRNSCDRSEKSKFNSNLIENFKIEYRRTNISSEGDKNVERVLSWKFVILDKDGDGFLDKTEYKELRRLARKAVRPKKCARTFARNCDLNRDSKLSRQEWGACLANDFTLLRGNPAPTHSRPEFRDDPPDASDDIDANDCLSDRKSVLEDSEANSEEKFYIPQCTPDGRYHRVQCYSGYCWCVYQDTGKPIPGTSSKDREPNCTPVPTPSRPMNGCPEAKKEIFLRDLMTMLHRKMKASNSDSDETFSKWQASKEERVATWHFVMLDKNKNKVLERKEWKNFRSMVSYYPDLRRCGKKFPKYCDVNSDRKINMSEWLNCLNAQRFTAGFSVTSTEKTPTSKPRRMGPNPLDRFLNDDD
ncbi:SPARC-related modular calcium-binding protein 2 [Belonocnema kinseyi]|uniref:SPARC-related modular calcium-binding protein 2 n=1 Tax=Belonocnema kinseyi TaxID=2817044 RepID=UPI00143D7ABF|nr:SPARC-related modular calcium-binding protein 2 [Belonocnema kinseyi]